MEGGHLVAERYRLLDVVGSGGMGQVWRAQDLELPRVVALKRGHPDVSEQEMVAEARLTARIDHPGVVRVLDVVRHRDLDGGVEYWLVLEYFPSRSLAEVLTDGPLPVRRVAEIGVEAAAALDATHRAGVLHRDLAPGNLLLGDDGRVKIADFGIATEIADDLDRTVRPGRPVTPGRARTPGGTLLSMSPEVADDRTATTKSDVYSLAATLFQAVQGTPQVGDGTPGSDPARLRRSIVDGRRNPATRAGRLRPVLDQMMSVDPDDRPDAATAQRRLRRARRPNRLIAAGVGVLVVGLLVATWAVVAPRPAASQTGSPPIPASVGPITVTDPATVDPCALTDLAWLYQFGDPRQVHGFLPHNCRITIATPDQGELLLDVFYDDPVTGVSTIEGTTRRLGAITVSTEPVGDGGFCRRSVILSDSYVVRVEAEYEDVDLSACPLADVGLATAVTALARDGVRYSAERYADYSLHDVDACEVLDDAPLDAVAELASDQRLPGFANRSCEYGTLDDGDPGVWLVFTLDDAYVDEHGTRTTVAGRPAQVELTDGDFNAQLCRVWVVHWEADGPDRPTEMFSLEVDADEPPETLCRHAVDLAEVAVRSLPTTS